MLQWGEQRAREVHVVKGKMDLAPPTERVGGLLKAVQWPDNYEVVTFIFESKLHG
jgi:hypothetical protein